MPAWWYMSTISALRRQRQEDLKFQTSLGYQALKMQIIGKITSWTLQHCYMHVTDMHSLVITSSFLNEHSSLTYTIKFASMWNEFYWKYCILLKI
jgi:hypothetical protein